MSAAQSSKQIQSALSEIETKVRVPVIMHYYQGLTHQQIAEQLQMQRSTVTRHIDRALNRIRNMVRNPNRTSVQPAA
jgi:RNA polymerase sigma factor (sigma-70 family)